MWKYRKEVIESDDTDPIDIVQIMDELSEDGWETFSIDERSESHQTFGGKVTTTYYTLYMKINI